MCMVKYVKMIELTRKMDARFMATTHAKMLSAGNMKEFNKVINSRRVADMFIEALRVRYGKTPWHDESHAKLGGIK